MTTHHERTDVDATSAAREDEAAVSQAAERQEGAAVTTESVAAEQAATETGRSTDKSLFADTDQSGLRSRWDEVQAAFVDNPKECVQKADTLVAEVVDQVTASFTEARSRLEEQWARGEQASTEDLRVALTRYRDFFQRLLSV